MQSKIKRKQSRHTRLRRRIVGQAARPRLAVFRSNQHIYAQAIDDVAGKTLASASDLKMGKMDKSTQAFEVGRSLAESLVKKGVKSVVFDRGGFLYHGRVAKLAEGVRKGGLKF